jgi:hypothetical protein
MGPVARTTSAKGPSKQVRALLVCCWKRSGRRAADQTNGFRKERSKQDLTLLLGAMRFDCTSNVQPVARRLGDVWITEAS